MIKLNWENHTNILCDIENGIDKIHIKCSAEFKEGNVDYILEVGNVFKFGNLEAKLIKAKYNNSNIRVFYEFENNKEGF